MDEACEVLGGVLDRVNHSHLELTRGDLVCADLHGGVIAAAYPNGMRLELTLRRSHPTHDREVDSGIWKLDGGAWQADGTGAADSFMTLAPDATPQKLGELAEQLLRSLVRTCHNSVVAVLAARPAAAAS